MKKKILIVEDNNDSRAILVLMLTNMGYQANRGSEQQRGYCVRGGRTTSPHFYGYGATGL